MKFSDTSNKNGIIQTIEIALQFPDGGISGDATLLKQFTGLINNAYNEVAAQILEMSPNWRWDDSNYTDHPRGTATLVDGQRDYTLPVASSGLDASTLLQVERICVLDKSGNEVELIPSNRSEAELNLAYTTSSLPREYKLTSNSAKIWPAADAGVSVTLAAGFIVYFRRTPDQFTSSDTTQQPGFIQSAHPILAYKAALDYAAPRGLATASFCQTRIQELYDVLKRVYSERDKSFRNRINPRRERYN